MPATRSRSGSAHIGFALANEAALELAVNKEKTLAAAGELGLYVPRSVILHGVDELPVALDEVGLPAVRQADASRGLSRRTATSASSRNW